ncbi:MAG: ABC transporter ATP-binding protein [Melioribacteraceae bacterium]|nr:ABC transporter ATP-binding protein [Melioribacteraceae bacterium]
MKTLSELNKYFIKYKNKLALGILFIIISDVSQVIIPFFLKEAIDSFKENITIESIVKYALFIVVAAVISGIFRFFIRETIIVVSREIEYDLRQDFWTHIQKLSYRFFQNTTTGNIMAHATNDIAAVRMYVGPAVMYSVDTFIKSIIVITILISINPLLTFYTLIPLPFMSVAVYYISKKLHKKFTKIQERFSDLTTKAQESFSGIRVVKSYVREKREIYEFTNLSDLYFTSMMDKVKLQAFFMPIIFFITGLSVIVIILFGGRMVIDKELTIGEIAAFVAYIGMLTWPMIAFGWVMNLIQQASASMKRLKKMQSEKSEISDTEITDYSINDISGKIEFKNVSFKYKEDLPEVLSNINLKVNNGETLAIVGHTGVGKTSFVNLIPRLYDTVLGDILIDDKPIKEIPLNILRKNIGIVPQEAFLFSDTIENNILYGADIKDDNLLKEVSKISLLDKDVESFPNKYNTILGERGITLSGGQKQRTSLARALAIDPKILILDDSFSAIDTKTEEEILINLKAFMKNRTSIIISHRISTVKDSDKIIVLDDGKITEEGTHDELVAKKGIYADIHFKQLLEDELKQIN